MVILHVGKDPETNHIFAYIFFFLPSLHFSSPHTSILLLFLYPYAPGSKTGLKGKSPVN